MEQHIGKFQVTERGIERVVSQDLPDFGGYITETVIPKEVFIEAYEKWIANKET